MTLYDYILTFFIGKFLTRKCSFDKSLFHSSYPDFSAVLNHYHYHYYSVYNWNQILLCDQNQKVFCSYVQARWLRID